MKHQDDQLLQRVLKMTYDKVRYTYGVTIKSLSDFVPQESSNYIPLNDALDMLESQICSRKLTGNEAKQYVSDLIMSSDTYVLERIIDRTIKCHLGRTQINKVWKGLITKPVYMRCGIFNTKTSKKIKFPAFIQMKCDGTYREFCIIDGEVSARSRSGEPSDYPVLNEYLSKLPNGVYVGELTVDGVSDRSIGNGMINSDNPPHDDINVDFWDYISIEEYNNALNKVKNTTPYSDRFDTLISIIEHVESDNVNIVPHCSANSIQDALNTTSDWMNMGYEGGVLKNMDGLFRDGTSPDQLKLKVEFAVDVRVVGFKEGKVGTKREKTFGSIEYSTDDGKVHGFVSGFSDAMLKKINNNRQEYLNQVFELMGNDLTKSVGTDVYAISHPRFSEFRTDKTETDDIQRCLDSVEMSKTLA